ncbi:divergent CRAL/TRIO domain-containing protein [Neohortaea acidophila]|uniref:Divergent CRAL/TRIO domain-containing protein n=1 Tax=Neohortaea acidophila TaxID=245834 RepID=A0A6A6PJA1_9PEZI|nr:divergent CRAL/TRIO domain-containing protein [Neohortaea acidophila]KAF2480120.1 divergent CRAL/TRIO domain-containing protein [Neohortaea acidophila]
MRSALAHAAHRRAERRQRASSLSTVPPAVTSSEYSRELASIAAAVLYPSPLPAQSGRRVYILNAAAFPDAFEADYDSLLSYVLARLPSEDELLSGTEYEIIFFAGGQPDNVSVEKKQGPGMGWYLQAYHVLSRATRKRLQRIYIVHPRTWVRVLLGVFGTIVSPKFRRKIVHVNTLSALALQIPVEKLLIPPAVYLHDRKLSPDIYVPYVTGKRAFGVKHPLPKNISTGETRIPRVLRETTTLLIDPSCIRREGLFRIPAHATLAGVLKEAYDRGQYFLVWKEQGVTVVQPGIDRTLVDEVRLEEAYGVHLAASLIKQWYRDLREPVFPESSYHWVNEKYSDPETPVTPEGLTDILLPMSDLSPLTHTARQILTRHLLPLLSEVAAHHEENKMTAENLAILFSMCLVCGGDQLQDAKVASIIKRLLKAAIEIWPQLRDGMGMSVDAFHTDMQPPSDLREYEDPLEENLPPPKTQLQHKDVEFEPDEEEETEGHRITLEDAETSPQKKAPPKLPPRILDRSVPERNPTLAPRPLILSVASSTSSSTSAGDPTVVPKRKPAPPVVDPPRYSSMFDADGNSIHVADSPSSYVPADGFGPPKRGAWSIDSLDKRRAVNGEAEQSTTPPAAINMPKRKAVSAEHRVVEPVAPSQDADQNSTRSSSDGSTLAKMAAQKAAVMMGRRESAASETSNPTTIAGPASNVATEDDGVFRKPTWPASARPQSLAKPVQPIRAAQTFPVSTNGSYGATPGGPRPRTPSPGLLRRMSAMEVGSNGTGSTSRPVVEEPRRLDLRRPSVDDLKRLYEERASTVLGLAKAADAARRASTSN